jgi:nucleotide-binding universal stress UspA family protein
VILRCLEPQANQRYPSASHLMFDLRNHDQITITERGRKTTRKGFWWHFKRWIQAAGMQYQASPLPSEQISEVPIVMVALPNNDVSDATLYALRQATIRSLGTRPGAKLAIVTVINTGITGSSDNSQSETSLQRQHLGNFKKWAEGLNLQNHQVSFHVIESANVAQALLRYAEGNKVNLIIMGAATHGLALQNFIATVPISVAMRAPCTVILVKESLPFEQIA